MGTTYSVKVSSLPAELSAESLQADIDRCLAEVNRQMSTWQEDSELSKFNRYRETPTGFPYRRSSPAWSKPRLKISELTGGAFDVTVGPLVNLWSFGPDKTESQAARPIPSSTRRNRAWAIGFSMFARTRPL